MEKIVKSKKYVALLLAAILIMSMSMTAFGQTIETKKGGSGSITIANAFDGETYTVYKIFDVTYEEVTSTNEEGSETTEYYISYTTDATTAEAMSDIDGCPFEFTSNDNDTYYVTVGTKEDGETYDDDEIIAFIKKYVETLSENDVYYKCEYDLDEDSNDDAGTLVLKGVEYGYYYITTTTGTLVTINTTTPDVTVEDKNTAPSDDKNITGDYDEDDESSATVGDTVTFEIEITVGKGAKNYVLHDTMSDGLTFSGDVEITVDEVEIESGEAGDGDETVVYWTLSSSNLEDSCTFEIEFNNDWLATLSVGTKIVVTYSATVNSSAVDKDVVTNKEYVSYGDSSESTGDTTTTYLYSFGINKTNSSNEELDGAEFELYSSYNEATGEYGDVIYFKYDKDNKTYNVVEYDEENSSTITAGNVTVNGLGAGTYYLVETKAPDGYNILSEAIVIVISEGEEGSYEVAVSGAGVIGTSGNYRIDVVNNAGSELPSTGGVGTTVLYILGIVLVLGAGVVLVVKRRANT